MELVCSRNYISNLDNLPQLLKICFNNILTYPFEEHTLENI